ncbi:flagellar assembly protein FliW [Paenibacillus crassostreae]|uniref:Flagellar assembly factor FliW n=1 Tax=Paenibacillus crassostreae TaxID=1763538 RepID=A0A167D8C4_9BACL|nr:flagellar assembly protein FliW [Paenibacillus crassostreae]AOZ93237.1 flagellar assembly protein FliW [Paenibacillus crassostreae]OAB74060.1 flagellar assembly protein FliW [Paenibacillus crassostreae]
MEKYINVDKHHMQQDLKIVTFPKGLPGFELLKEFTVQQYDELFSVLISVDNPSVAFIVVNPFDFYPNYEFDVSDDLLEEIEITSREQVNIRCIVTWHSNRNKVTLNLLAPIIINSEKHSGKQVVLQNVSYTTRQLLWSNGIEDSEGGED